MQLDPNNMTPEEQAAIEAIMQEMLKDELRQLRGDVRISDIPGDAPPSLSNPNSERDDLVASLLGPKAGEMSRDLDSALSAVPDVAYSAIGGPMIEEGSKQAVHGTRHGDIAEALAGYSKMLAPAAMPTRAFAPAYAAAGALELNNRNAFSPTEAYAAVDDGDLSNYLRDKIGNNADVLLEYMAPALGAGVAAKGASKLGTQPAIDKAERSMVDALYGLRGNNQYEEYRKLAHTGLHEGKIKDFTDVVDDAYAQTTAPKNMFRTEAAFQDDFSKANKTAKNLERTGPYAGAGIGAGTAVGIDAAVSEEPIDESTAFSAIAGALFGGKAHNPRRSRNAVAPETKAFDGNAMDDYFNRHKVQLGPFRKQDRRIAQEVETQAPKIESGAKVKSRTGGAVDEVWPDDIRKAAVEMMNKGMSVKEVAEKTGIPSRSLYRWR